MDRNPTSPLLNNDTGQAQKALDASLYGTHLGVEVQYAKLNSLLQTTSFVLEYYLGPYIVPVAEVIPEPDKDRVKIGLLCPDGRIRYIYTPMREKLLFGFIPNIL